MNCTRCRIKGTEDELAEMAEGERYCLGCLEGVFEEEQILVKGQEQRFILYKEFESLDEAKWTSGFEIDQQVQIPEQVCEEKVRELQAEETQLEKEGVELAERVQTLETKVLNLEKQEASFWEQINRFQKRACKLEEKLLQAEFEKVGGLSELDKVSKFNPIQELAGIDIDEWVGYVCGLAMGKRPDLPQVLWDEVNAGLGHLVMLLSFMAIRYRYEFSYLKQLKFLGSYSEAVLPNRKDSAPIGYTTKDQQKRFGSMMDALLSETVALYRHMQIIQKVEYLEEMKLPFLVHDGRIGEFSFNPIHLQEKNRWINWTKAVRYYLINFKHILTLYSLNDPYV